MISDMIKTFAMSTDESRSTSTGPPEGGKEQRPYPANGSHRWSPPVIASADPKVEQVIGLKGNDHPRKGITESAVSSRTRKAVELGVKKGMCVLKKDGIILKVSLIDAEYPDYKRVVPKDKGTLVELNRDPVLHALRRMSVMASERYSGVRIRFQQGKMVLNSINPDVGEASDEVEIQYEDGEIEVGFNVRYLLSYSRPSTRRSSPWRSAAGFVRPL
jgi:DNA polymerase-3 subunit beta